MTANVTVANLPEAIDLVIQSRNKLGGDEDYVAKLHGHSATSINPERPQYLLLAQSTSSGLISVLRVRQSQQNILTILKAYESKFLKGIGLSRDQDSWKLTLAFLNTTELSWVSRSDSKHVGKFVYKFVHALERARKSNTAAALRARAERCGLPDPTAQDQDGDDVDSDAASVDSTKAEVASAGPASESRPLPTPGSQEEGDPWEEGIQLDEAVEDGDNPMGGEIPAGSDAERASEEASNAEATTSAAPAPDDNGYAQEQVAEPTTASAEICVTSDEAPKAPVLAPPLSSADRYTAEMSLLDVPTSDQAHSSELHEIMTAPLVTCDANDLLAEDQKLVQYGLLGAVQSMRSKTGSVPPKDCRLYLNSNAPFSATVCGVQGSGKSHTVAVMLEDMLIPRYPALGELRRPLSALVLHFGEGGPSAQPCEAAWLGVPSVPDLLSPRIKIFVSPSSIATMRRVYAPLGAKVVVEPLYFQETELDAEAILSMMAVGPSTSAPLYIQIILSILRELGEKYTWSAFQARLETKKKSFNEQQLAGLEQRMSLLQSFMKPWAHKFSQPQSGYSRDTGARFAEGQMTIVDLSDPFIDAASACGIFEIVTRLFQRADVGTGKVLVVDEAHKYLSNQAGSASLTQALLKMIRQMRHLALRVIISTQEPTVVPPVLLELCSLIVIHRFSSPAWWEHLKSHVSSDCAEEGFDEVVKLRVGEALVFAPTALVAIQGEDGEQSPQQLARRYLAVKTRRRVTQDGGASILVMQRPH